MNKKCNQSFFRAFFYESVVLPKALYGCELWSNLSPSELQPLERVHTQCIKYMQQMHQCTRTDVALSCLGLLPIECEIDKRKLIFFGQLCNLNTEKRVKSIFVARLYQYLMNPRKSTGFISDIVVILGKYDLLNDFTDFHTNGSFPSLNVWKKKVRKQIILKTNNDFESRLKSDQTLLKFYQIHNEISPFSAWYLSRLYRECLLYCRTVMMAVRRYFARKYNTICPKCKMLTDSIIEHLTMFCIPNSSYRHSLWCNIHHILGNEKYVTFCELESSDQIVEMISGYITFNINEKDRIKIVKLTYRFLHYMFKDLMIFIPR